MSRQEDFKEAGIQYRFAHGTPMAIGGGHFAEMTKEMNRTKPFEAGCEHGYQYALERACEWLEQHLLNAECDGYMTTDIYKQFKQAMQ